MDIENTTIPRLLLKMSPPVMLALLIQSIYNIADSFFVAKYSTEGLTALSIIYPVQLLITALATGTGAGVNILISRLDGRGEKETQHDIIKSGLFINMIHFVLFALVGNLLIKSYFDLIYLYQDPSGKGKHDRSHDCADYRIGCQYFAGCYFDFWNGEHPVSWNYRCSDSYRDRAMGGNVYYFIYGSEKVFYKRKI